MELPGIVEALLFASPNPLSARAIVRCIQRADEEPSSSGPTEPATQPGNGHHGSPENHSENGRDKLSLPGPVNVREVEDAIATLNARYARGGHAFRIAEEAGGWRMLSHPDYGDWVRLLYPEQKPARLSTAALETLAIIAYRQPVTKAAVEGIRGVSIDGILQKIVDRGLVRSVGRANLPGRPLLYGTSDLFMEHFGIRDLDELPNATELRVMELPGDSAEAVVDSLSLDETLAKPEQNGSERQNRPKLSPVTIAKRKAGEGLQPRD